MTSEARIRQSLADLDSPEAAPRLNAQVRLREEHVEMLKLLLLELDSIRLGVQMAGDNMTWKLPTEELKTEIEELRRKLASAEAALAQARVERCPDPNCPNCRKWKDWEALNGDVDWKVCPRCSAGVGEPCRHVGRGVGRGYAPVLRRPHKGRPGELRGAHPTESPL